MVQDVTGQNDYDLTVTDKLDNRQTEKEKAVIVKRVFTRSRQCIVSGINIYRQKLAPYIHKGSCYLANEIVKIHSKQNWFKRCSITLFDNAAGLAMAMLAGNIVQNSFEVEQFSNLWGLLATRPVVSETTYEVLSFAVEFLIALIVFTLTEHYIEEYRRRKKPTEISEN